MIVHEKLILIDVDSVLLDWLSGFHSWMATTGFVDAFGLSETPSKDAYDLTTSYSLPDSQIFTLIKAFNTSVFMGELAPMPGAKQALSRLVEKEYTFHPITSFADNQRSFELRKHNLIKVFGEDTFSGFTFLPLRASKQEVLNTFAKSHIVKPLVWIDDLLHHAKAGVTSGITSIHYDPYNVSSQAATNGEVTYCLNWRDIEATIEDLYERSGS